jgi:hypothetical protein
MTSDAFVAAPGGPAFRFPPERWLWCLHCCRFFQGRDARADAIGGWQGCAFADCSGAGYGVDIHDWAEWGKRDDGTPLPGWPALGELRKGLRVDGMALLDDGDGEPGNLWRDDAACLGIGPALNSDGRLRDAILKVVDLDYDDGVAYLGDLDLATLETLVAERFLPEFNGLRGPSTSRVLRFMRRWPAVRAYGYAVHPSRADHRVTLEGLECDLDQIAPRDRASFCAEFAAAFDAADHVVTGNARTSAFWS